MSQIPKRRRSPSQGAAVSPTSAPSVAIASHPHPRARYPEQLALSISATQPAPCAQSTDAGLDNPRAKRQRIGQVRNRVVSPRNCDTTTRPRRPAQSRRTAQSRPKLSKGKHRSRSPVDLSPSSAADSDGQLTSLAENAGSASSDDNPAYDGEDEDEDDGDEVNVELGMADMSDFERTSSRRAAVIEVGDRSAPPSPGLDAEGEEVDNSLFASPLRARSRRQSVDVKGKGVDPLEYGHVSLKRRHSDPSSPERRSKSSRQPLEPTASIVNLTNGMDGLSARSLTDIVPAIESDPVSAEENTTRQYQTDLKALLTPILSTVGSPVEFQRPSSPDWIDNDIEMLSPSEHSDAPLSSGETQVKERRIQRIHERRKRTLRRRFDKMSLNASEVGMEVSAVVPFPLLDVPSHDLASLFTVSQDGNDEHTVNASLFTYSRRSRPYHMTTLRPSIPGTLETARVLRASLYSEHTEKVAFPMARRDLLRRRSIASHLALPHLAIHRSRCRRQDGLLTGQEIMAVSRAMLAHQRERRRRLSNYNKGVRVEPWELSEGFKMAVRAMSTREGSGAVEETEVEQLLPDSERGGFNTTELIATPDQSNLIHVHNHDQDNSHVVERDALRRRRRETVTQLSADQRARVVRPLRVTEMRRDLAARAELRRAQAERATRREHEQRGDAGLSDVEAEVLERDGSVETDQEPAVSEVHAVENRVSLEPAQIVPPPVEEQPLREPEIVPEVAEAAPIFEVPTTAPAASTTAPSDSSHPHPPPAYEPPLHPLPATAPILPQEPATRHIHAPRPIPHSQRLDRGRNDRPPLYRPNRYNRRSPSPPPPYNAATDRDVLIHARFDTESEDADELVGRRRRGSRSDRRQNRRRTIVGAFPETEADLGISDGDVDMNLDPVALAETAQPVAGPSRHRDRDLGHERTILPTLTFGRRAHTQVSSFDVALELEEGEDIEMAIWVAENALAARQAREEEGERGLAAVGRWIGNLWRWGA